MRVSVLRTALKLEGGAMGGVVTRGNGTGREGEREEWGAVDL